MAGLVANPPSPPAPAITDQVAGDGWYPGLSVAAFIAVQRVPAVVTPQRAHAALVGGILSASAELADWRADQEAAGAQSLAEAIVRDARGREQTPIGDEARALVLWRRAVHAYALADLELTHSDISATADGRGRAEEQASRAPDQLRVATLAIRDLLGQTRTRVRLL